jgi:hypothetical protein
MPERCLGWSNSDKRFVHLLPPALFSSTCAVL